MSTLNDASRVIALSGALVAGAASAAAADEVDVLSIHDGEYSICLAEALEELGLEATRDRTDLTKLDEDRRYTGIGVTGAFGGTLSIAEDGAKGLLKATFDHHKLDVPVVAYSVGDGMVSEFNLVNQGDTLIVTEFGSKVLASDKGTGRLLDSTDNEARLDKIDQSQGVVEAAIGCVLEPDSFTF